jgi:hypothetical protein
MIMHLTPESWYPPILILLSKSSKLVSSFSDRIYNSFLTIISMELYKIDYVDEVHIFIHIWKLSLLVWRQRITLIFSGFLV